MYRVEFETKKGGSKDWKIDIPAKSQKSAKELAIAMWNEKHKDIHSFRMIARKLNENEKFNTDFTVQ